MFENHRKLTFNIAREASYAYFLSGQNFIKKPKMVNFDEFLQTVLPDRSLLIGQKLVENVKIEKFKWDIMSNFQTLCF